MSYVILFGEIILVRWKWMDVLESYLSREILHTRVLNDVEEEERLAKFYTMPFYFIFVRGPRRNRWCWQGAGTLCEGWILMGDSLRYALDWTDVHADVVVVALPAVPAHSNCKQ